MKLVSNVLKPYWTECLKTHPLSQISAIISVCLGWEYLHLRIHRVEVVLMGIRTFWGNPKTLTRGEKMLCVCAYAGHFSTHQLIHRPPFPNSWIRPWLIVLSPWVVVRVASCPVGPLRTAGWWGEGGLGLSGSGLKEVKFLLLSWTRKCIFGWYVTFSLQCRGEQPKRNIWPHKIYDCWIKLKSSAL